VEGLGWPTFAAIDAEALCLGQSLRLWSQLANRSSLSSNAGILYRRNHRSYLTSKAGFDLEVGIDDL